MLASIAEWTASRWEARDRCGNRPQPGSLRPMKERIWLSVLRWQPGPHRSWSRSR
jgi:hypothetical protein